MHEKIISEKRGAAVICEHKDHTTALRTPWTDGKRGGKQPITMVCPMRFVLVGFSVVVATLGFFIYSGGPESPCQGEKPDPGGTSNKKNIPSTGQRLWGFFNGHFLFQESMKARKKGGITYLLFSVTIIILLVLTVLYVILPYFIDKTSLSNFCPHHYIPYAHEIKSGYKLFIKILKGEKSLF